MTTRKRRKASSCKSPSRRELHELMRRSLQLRIKILDAMWAKLRRAA